MSLPPAPFGPGAPFAPRAGRGAVADGGGGGGYDGAGGGALPPSRGGDAAAARALRPMSADEWAAAPGRLSGPARARRSAAGAAAGCRLGRGARGGRPEVRPGTGALLGGPRPERAPRCLRRRFVHRLRLEVHHHPERRARRLCRIEPVEHVLQHLLRRAVQRVAVAAAARAIEGHHVARLDAQPGELRRHGAPVLGACVVVNVEPPARAVPAAEDPPGHVLVPVRLVGDEPFLQHPLLLDHPGVRPGSVRGRA